MLRRISTSGAVAVLALGFAGAARAEVAAWTIDPTHSWVGFTVRHMMVATVRGEFGKFSGTVTVEGDDPTAAKVEVSVDVASIDTREPKRDDHLRSADFFDAAKFPVMMFTSRRVEKTSSGFSVIGDLTLRGVTKEVALDVTEITGPIADPWGNSRIGAHASTKIKRGDFGVSWNRALEAGGWVVSDEVNVIIDVALVKKAPAPAPQQ